MSLKLRLARAGAKKRPYYAVVVANSRSPRDGRFIEKVGTYNPLVGKDDANRFQFDEERVKYWLSKGATPTDRVARFLSTTGLVSWKAATSVKKAQPKARAQERAKERAEREAATAAEATAD